jgi:hypothetical protein
MMDDRESPQGVIEKELSEDEAWGGFTLAGDVLRLSVQKIQGLFGLKWLLPEYRCVEMRRYNGVELPCMKIFFRGYLLILEVKESLIPNAGYGVFLSMQTTSRLSSLSNLTLEPGELIDIGVYGPQRPQDCRSQNAFVLKSL